LEKDISLAKQDGEKQKRSETHKIQPGINQKHPDGTIFTGTSYTLF